MSPERWEQIKRSFQTALDLPLEGRSTFLAQLGSTDSELRSEVESLLISSDQDDFLAGTAADYVPAALAGEASDRNIGRAVGAYRIIRLIGEGGMGEVYLANRSGEFQQQAAIKLLRPGMDSRGIIRRFLNERQILASLEHPNIARLLEGGTTDDDRPYFIMEYVEGLPIDEYADGHQLGIHQRLRLFQSVCAAVQYAHHHLVVHRDIKPGNILVAGHAATPKLLDFGIAKLLANGLPEDTAGITRTGLRPMTPEYASPEQVLSAPITTATDVYSLGAVLYKLLSGHTPLALANSSAAQIERAICEQDPRPPSHVAAPDFASQLRGDLDTIVLKALQKNPSQRYSSAEQLSADIQRYLDGRPIHARPQTLLYRTRRFVRRNRLGVAASALVIISITAAFGVALYQARVAHAQRLRAERRFDDVRRLAHTFLFDFHDAIQDLPGATPARHLVVNKALEYLDKLARESDGDPALERELAEAYLRVGDVQGNGRVANLGELAGAMTSYQRALGIAERAVRRDPRNLDGQKYLARAHMNLGDMMAQRGDADAAVAHYRPAVALFDAMAPRLNGDVATRFEMANASGSMADQLGNPGLPNLGDPHGAKAAYEKARSIFAGIANTHPDSVRAERAVGAMDMRIGDVEIGLHQASAGLRKYQSAVATFEAVLKRDPRNPTTRLFLGMGVGKLASAFESAGDQRSALAEYRKARDIEHSIVVDDPANVQAQSAYGFSLQALAPMLAKTGDRTAALATYREALALARRLLAADPDNPRRQARCADIQSAIDELTHSGGK